MPKTTLTLIALFWASLTFGQLKITTTQFQGKTYKVYPVRLPMETESEWSYSYITKRKLEKNGLWTVSTNELTLPFNPFNLADGDYLIYYKKRQRKWDKKERVWLYSHEDTTLVAATFTLVNNKKTGTAVWYDFVKPFKHVQTGYYENGIKSGKWQRYGKEESSTYHYQNGLLHGKYTTMYKSKLYEDFNYLHGELDGVNITYHKKSDAIKEEQINQNGYYLESKKYDKKHRLTYWHTTRPTDNITLRKYDKGVLIESHTDYDSLNCYSITEWYPNGNLKERSYAYSQYGQYNGKIYKESWYNANSIGLMRVLGSRNIIACERYYKNGQLEIKYDARIMDMRQPVPSYNKKGRMHQTVQMDAEDSSLVTTLLYDKHNYPYYKRVYYKGRESLMRMRTLANGDTTFYTAHPYYLSIHNPEKTGFKKSYYSSGKKNSTTEYNLLHSDVGILTRTFKGNDALSADFKNLNDSVVEVLQHEHDVSNTFKVTHTYQYKIPQRSDVSDMSFFYEDRTETRSINNIFTLYDTLDYTITLFDRPYSGSIKAKEKFTYKDKRYKFKLKIRKEKYGGVVYYDTSIKLTTYVGMPYDYWYTKNIGLNCIGGQVSRIKLGNDQASYTDLKKQGEGKDAYGFRGHYVDGQRHGLYMDYTNYREYYKGLQHGIDMETGYYGADGRYDHQLKYKANFDMDTLHGLYVSFAKPEVVQQSMVFNKGLPNGKYFRGNVTSPVSVSVDLHNGYMVDTGYYYFKEGILKAKVFYQLKDSVFYLKDVAHPLYITGTRQEYLMRSEHSDYAYSKYHSANEDFLGEDKIIDFEADRTADYQYFYKNGVMASTGRIENMQKVGTWQYWDLNGQLYKEITYDTGWHVSASNDSIKYYGKVKMWYPNGNELLTGLVKDVNFRFKCDQEMKVNLETLHYLTYFNENGEQTIKQGTGKVTEYHNNGELRLSGELRNGKRYGAWRFYDPNGRLEMIGKYDANGEKHGLWVSGDLEAVPYYENMCLDGAVNAYNFPDVDKTGYVTQKISIAETMYDEGSRKNTDYTTLLPLY